MNKQNVEVQITLNYYDQSAEPIDGRLQPSSERVMRDLYEMLRDGKTITYHRRHERYDLKFHTKISR